MNDNTEKIIECLQDIAFAIREHNDTLNSIAEDMWTRTQEAGRVHTIAGLMFNSGYALDRLQEISTALQKIEKHHERD